MGRSTNRTFYNDMESCLVSHDSYGGIKFSILKFTLKPERKILSIGQVTKVAVPDDVTLEKILQILRDKGVKIVEEILPS
jgi:hypothetical protein